MIGWLATFKTAVGAHTWFLPWLGGAALAAFLAGAGAGGWAAWKIQDGRVARAEAAVMRLQSEQTQAIADAASKNVLVTQDVLGDLHATRESITALAGDVRRLGRAVSLCNATSSMPVPGAAAGADAEAGDGQARPAVDVLQELAADSAEAADRNAAQLNALIEWIEGVRK